MIKNKEEIIQKHTEKIREQVKIYVEEIDTLSETKGFRIEKIEKEWGKLEDKTKEVYKEINEELIRQLDEKEIIRIKKRNMGKKE